jgi:hypothetical protein
MTNIFTFSPDAATARLYQHPISISSKSIRAKQAFSKSIRIVSVDYAARREKRQEARRRRKEEEGRRSKKKKEEMGGEHSRCRSHFSFNLLHSTSSYIRSIRDPGIRVMHKINETGVGRFSQV